MKFIHLQEGEMNTLIGGFSYSIGISGTTDNFASSNNNCNGGNCSKSTCSKQKFIPAGGANTNCKGNCVKGCGKKH